MAIIISAKLIGELVALHPFPVALAWIDHLSVVQWHQHPKIPFAR